VTPDWPSEKEIAGNKTLVDKTQEGSEGRGKKSAELKTSRPKQEILPDPVPRVFELDTQRVGLLYFGITCELNNAYSF
jgi:hypothetical protein